MKAQGNHRVRPVLLWDEAPTGADVLSLESLIFVQVGWAPVGPQSHHSRTNSCSVVLCQAGQLSALLTFHSCLCANPSYQQITVNQEGRQVERMSACMKPCLCLRKVHCLLSTISTCYFCCPVSLQADRYLFQRDYLTGSCLFFSLSEVVSTL